MSARLFFLSIIGGAMMVALWVPETALARSVGAIPVQSVLAPGQKWFNSEDNVIIQIEKVNTMNSTFSASYGIIRGVAVANFPIRGEFDPNGVSIGWIVSYWNQNENDHALGAWSGFTERDPTSDRPVIVATRIISHQEDSSDTTIGFDRFVLQ